MEYLEAFEKINKTMMSDLFLTHNNPDLEIIVISDASSYSVGACIFHKMTDRKLKPNAYASRASFPAEKIIRKLKKRLLGLYSQSQSSTAIFTFDTSLCKQTTSHYSPFLAKKGLPMHTVNTAEMGYNPVKLKLQNGVPTIEKIQPCGDYINQIIFLKSISELRTSSLYATKCYSAGNAS